MKYNASQIHPFGLLIEPKQTFDNLSNLDTDYLRKHLDIEKLIVLRGFNTFKDANAFSTYCERWGEISIWPFGKVLELIEHDNPKDHIFDNRYVPLHWDGMYRPQVPELQIFHCAKAPLAGQGGKTTFSNTISTLEQASFETKKIWNKVTGFYQRKMEFYQSKTALPIINTHPYKDFSVIRYNEPHSRDKGDFINPPELEFQGIDAKELENFHHSLKQALYHPNNFYAHEWQTGDVVIADNFSLLHGREAFTTKSPRHLQRVHVLSHPAYDNPGLEYYK